ncbi:helix-turn-helix domain-containing protein [Enterococcus alishanensis]
MRNVDNEMKSLAKTIRWNLYLLLGSKNMTIVELSKKSGVSETTISRIKNDRNGSQTPKSETVVRLAAALDVDPQVLFSQQSNELLMQEAK